MSKDFCKVFLGAVFCFALAGQVNANANNLDNTIDLRVLVDVSGSMKNTDPNNMRSVALQVLTQILPDNMNAGIWLFDGKTRPLVPLGKVNNAWRDQVLKATQNVAAKGRFTNIQEALTKGIEAASSQQQHVILLTDGKVDLSNDKVANARSRNLLLSGLWQDNQTYSPTIHTIALSSNTDQRLLREIARQSGGLHTTAKNADQLMQFFLRALDNAHVSSQLEVQNFSDNTQAIAVDKNTAQIKLIVKTDTPQTITAIKDPQGNLVTPDNNQVQVTVLDDQQIITINNPTAGQWQLVDKEATITRVNVVNDLAVDVMLQDTNVYLGQTSQTLVTLTPKASGKSNTSDSIQGTVTLSLIDEANKTRWQTKRPIKDYSMQKGRTSIPITLPGLNQTGLYRLKTQVSLMQLGTGDFSRELFIDKYLRVHPPIDYEATVINNTYTVTVTPLYDKINLDNSQVRVTTQNNQGVKRAMTLPLGIDKWQTTWQTNQPIKLHSIEFIGETFAGKTIKFAEKNVNLQVLSVQDSLVQQQAKSVAVDNLPEAKVVSVEATNQSATKALTNQQGVSQESPSSSLQNFIGDNDTSTPTQDTQKDNNLPIWLYWLIGVVVALLLLGFYLVRGRQK